MENKIVAIKSNLFSLLSEHSVSVKQGNSAGMILDMKK